MMIALCGALLALQIFENNLSTVKKMSKRVYPSLSEPKNLSRRLLGQSVLTPGY